MTVPSEPARQILLLDTHVLIWLMFGDPRLGSRARAEISQTCAGNRTYVSAITPWEVGVLVSKKRIELFRDLLDWVRAALTLPGISVAALEPEIAVASTRLPWEAHGDPADRILVATARHLGATLVTADAALLEFARQGHFKAMDATA